MTDLSTTRNIATPLPAEQPAHHDEQAAPKLSENLHNRSATPDIAATPRTKTPSLPSPNASEAKPTRMRLSERLRNFWKEKITTPFSNLRSRKSKLVSKPENSSSRLSRFKAALSNPFSALSACFKPTRERKATTTQPQRDLTRAIEDIEGSDAKNLNTIKDLLKVRVEKYKSSSLSDKKNNMFLECFGRVEQIMESAKERNVLLDTGYKGGVIDNLREMDKVLNRQDTADITQFEHEHTDFIGEAKALNEMELAPETKKLNDLFQKRVNNYAPKYQSLTSDSKARFDYASNSIQKAIADHQGGKEMEYTDRIRVRQNLQMLDSVHGGGTSEPEEDLQKAMEEDSLRHRIDFTELDSNK